jgi:tRNA(Ile)-lysidine synthase
MSLLQRFKQYIQQHHLFQPKDQLLLAVSGGVDSVVLADLCYKAGYQFSIAHCNFQLRGEESDADETFVRTLGGKCKVEVLVKKFDTEEYAATNKLSIQEAARALRYTWFEEMVNGEWSMVNGESKGETHHSLLIIHLLTAHHADDNNESLLMNFFRGTGLHGLTGIPAANGHIKRPLLSFTKQELLDYATEQGLQFREDSSNQSSKYTRNFFRNEIIPAIEKVYPQVKTNLTDNISRFLEIEQLYKLSTQAIIKKLCRIKGKEIHIPVKQLLQYNNKALIYEIIHPHGFSEKQIDEVLKLGESDSGKYIDSPAFHTASSNTGIGSSFLLCNLPNQQLSSLKKTKQKFRLKKGVCHSGRRTLQKLISTHPIILHCSMQKESPSHCYCVNGKQVTISIHLV